MARDSPRSSRRHFLTATGATGALAVAGCTDLLGADAADLRWVMNPAEEEIEVEAQYQPVIEELEDELGIEISGEPTQNYSATLEELEAAGEDDPIVADTSPGAVVQIPDEIDLVGVREAFGAERYFGTLVTTPESDINDVSDLNDESIVTNETQSVSGGLGPLWILDQHGLDIGDAVDGGDAVDFDHETVDGHDLAVNELVAEGSEYAAAGTGAFQIDGRITEENFNEFEEFADITVEEPADDPEDADLQLLATTDPLPRAPIVVNADWEGELRDDVVELLRDLEPQDLEHDAVELDSALALGLPDDLLEDYNAGELNDSAVAYYDLDEDQEDDWAILSVLEGMDSEDFEDKDVYDLDEDFGFDLPNDLLDDYDSGEVADDVAEAYGLDDDEVHNWEVLSTVLGLDTDDLGDGQTLADELSLELPDDLLDDYDEDGVIDSVPEAYGADEDDWALFDDHTLWFSAINETDQSTYDPIDDLASDLGVDFGEIE